MVVVIITMNALPQKTLELKQTLLGLLEHTRKEKGCLNHNVYQSMEDESDISLIQAWESREDFDDYLKSDGFTVFMGTWSLLSHQPEITMSDVSHSSEWDAVEEVRKEAGGES